MAENYNWSEFTLKIAVEASVKQVYDAWTAQHNLEQWFLRTAVFYKKDGSSRDRSGYIDEGDTYEWTWHGHGDEGMEKGRVTRANGVDMLQFSFLNDLVMVTVNMGEMLGKTIVMLKQEGIPADEHGKVHYHMGCHAGWTFFLTNLKSVLEGGLDLRNKDLNFTKVVNS